MSDELPKQICAYPIPGWRLDQVTWDAREGQPDGWIVSLKRESSILRERSRCYIVMARSDIGPLEAWDEALQIALRDDKRQSEAASLAARYPSVSSDQLKRLQGDGKITA